MSDGTDADSALPFTGERFVPGVKGEIWVEHWHRYHFAARWVRGKRVLDVACGEGYGTALLARHAAHVTGADLAQAAIDHAKRAYAALGNAEFVRAPCTRLPLADASIDVAVSFETLEHIGEQEAFLDELARVLKPEGVLILSCPNKLEYSDKRGFVNEFHVKELYRDELAALVSQRFPETAWYGQRPSFFSVIAPEKRPLEAELVETDEKHAAEANPRLTDPLYFLVVASRERAALAALPATLSVLADREHWAHRDYEKVMYDLGEHVVLRGVLEERIRTREQAIAALRADVGVVQQAKDQLDAVLAQRESTIAALNAALHARDLALAEKEHEINRRRGWRWWLKLPFIRLGLMK